MAGDDESILAQGRRGERLLQLLELRLGLRPQSARVVFEWNIEVDRLLGLGRIAPRQTARHETARCGLLQGPLYLLPRQNGRGLLRRRIGRLDFFETSLAPLFDKPFVRWATARQLSLYGLGIPPAQYAALGSGAPNMAAVLRDRVEKLSCEFSIDDNYFAWQAFGRSYSDGGSGPLPPYLERGHFDTIRDRADRVEVLNRSFTEYLKSRPAQSLDRYVLLDAQDWMSDLQLNDLWREITRTARPGARVIFRTAAEPSLLPGRVDKLVLARWRYETEVSRDLTRRDRSAIYGGFHLYVLAA